MCGLRVYPPYVMEWDHLPGTEKKLVLADTRRAAHARQRILDEIAKCELVCANCHRERTFSTRRRGPSGSPGPGLEPATPALRKQCSTN